MSESLFRTEALQSLAASHFGEHVFHQPLSVRVLVLGVALLFLAFLAFATFADIKRTEGVRGYLTPAAGEIKLYSSGVGILTEIAGQEGLAVRKGDVLATIVSTQFDEIGQQSSVVMLSHIDRQIAQLKERVSALLARSKITTEQLDARITGSTAELQLLKEEHRIVLQRLTLGQQEYEASGLLFERGAISSREHNQAASSWYSLLQASNSVQLSVESKKLALEEARQQLVMQPVTQNEELLLLQGGIAELLARRDEVAAQGLFTITAPDDGVISNLVTRVGDSIDPRIPFATLVPQNHTLEARLYLPSRSIGEVVIGQELMLSYDAYPQQTHGTFAARVVTISSTVIDPREFMIPLELNEPVYLVKANIERQSIGIEPGRSLRSGMQFSAEIITGSESMLQRLLSPLTSLGRKL